MGKVYARKDSNQLTSTLLTVLLPVFASVIATYADLFKLSTWQSPKEDILWPVGSCAILFGCVVLLKVYENSAKLILSGDLTALKAHRTAAVYTDQLFTALVQEKLGRIYSAVTANKGRVTKDQFLSTLNPRTQLAILFKSAHEHLARTLPPGYRLRIGLYRKSDDGKELERISEWDGSKNKCYSGRCRQYMKLGQPNPISELVKAYNGSENLIIHQSCYASLKKGKYRELSDEHRKKLKSMMVYRHELPPEHSTRGAMVLEVNTDCDNFFKEDDFGTHEAFFIALMSRLEYEYVTVDVTEALAP